MNAGDCWMPQFFPLQWHKLAQNQRPLSSFYYNFAQISEWVSERQKGRRSERYLLLSAMRLRNNFVCSRSVCFSSLFFEEIHCPFVPSGVPTRERSRLHQQTSVVEVEWLQFSSIVSRPVHPQLPFARCRGRSSKQCKNWANVALHWRVRSHDLILGGFARRRVLLRCVGWKLKEINQPASHHH